MSDQATTSTVPAVDEKPSSAVSDAEISALSAGAADRVLKGMPEDVRNSFSAVQRHALGEALANAKTGRFFVNLRFSLLGLFVNFIVGKENRSAARRKMERVRHPFFTLGNLMFMVFVWPIGILLGWATYVLLVNGGF